MARAHHPLGVGGLADVARDVRGADLRRRGGQHVLAPAGDDHVRAAGDEFPRGGLAEARSAAGHERHTFVQKAFREDLRCHRAPRRCRWLDTH